MDRFIAVRNESCLHCGFCDREVDCSQKETGICIGCGACIKGCPQKAISLRIRQRIDKPGASINCTIDGCAVEIEGPVSVLNAIKELRKEEKCCNSSFADDTCGALCETGGCWNCATLIDGVLTRSCLTPLQEGMDIVTDPYEIRRSFQPRRIVTILRPYPHYDPSIFTHGCNYSCDFCHNWDITFASAGQAMTPSEAIRKLNLNKQEDAWVGISGGEPTLNRRWLIETVLELKKTMPDICIQLDTNASLLTADYIDELVESGVTHISPDIKALYVDTFMKLCGVGSEEEAERYLETSWDAVRYIHDKYDGKVSMAVSFPYFPTVHTLEEIKGMAKALAKIDKDIPVTLIEYQPAFRLRDMEFIDKDDMKAALESIRSEGLRRVALQGGSGIPLAKDPLDLIVGSEEF